MRCYTNELRLFYSVRYSSSTARKILWRGPPSPSGEGFKLCCFLGLCPWRLLTPFVFGRGDPSPTVWDASSDCSRVDFLYSPFRSIQVFLVGVGRGGCLISTFSSGEGGPSRKRWWMRRSPSLIALVLKNNILLCLM